MEYSQVSFYKKSPRDIRELGFASIGYSQEMVSSAWNNALPVIEFDGVKL
jgi:hypothetical protein